MVKFSAKGGDKLPLLGIGLSDEDILNLKKSKPISIRHKDTIKFIEGKGRIVLFYGKTEEDIKEDLNDIMGTFTETDD